MLFMILIDLVIQL